MKRLELKNLIREEIKKALKEYDDDFSEDDLYGYEDGGQGSGSQSRFSKLKQVDLNSLKKGMRVVIDWTYDGGSGSGSQSDQLTHGTVKDIDRYFVYIEQDPAKIRARYTTKYAREYIKTGIPIMLRAINKIYLLPTQGV